MQKLRAMAGPRSTWARYGVAAVVFAVALLVRFEFVPQSVRLTFSTFYPAVALTLYYCGVGPGLLLAAAGALTAIYFFIPPFRTFEVDFIGALALSAFLLSSLVTAWVVHQLRTTAERLERTQETLRESEERLRDLYDYAPCGYASFDASGRFVHANRTMARWLGCATQDLLAGTALLDHVAPQDRPRLQAEFPLLVRRGESDPIEFDLQGGDGPSRRVSMSATAVYSADGDFVRSRSVLYDVTELDRVRRELHALSSQQAAMLDNELVGMLEVRAATVFWSNRALTRLFGYTAEELHGRPTRVLHVDDEGWAATDRDAPAAFAAGRTYRAQLWMRHRDGHPMWIDLNGFALAGQPHASVWMMLDMTAMKLRQQEVEQLAFNDALTGLPNRQLLIDRLHQAVPLVHRTASTLAVCFVDLDGFKAVNDTLGHAAGDAVLKAVALRLLACVRGNDTVARLGGDEFVLLLPQLATRDECHIVLERVKQEIARPVAVGDGRTAAVTASVGIAFCPDDGEDPLELLAAADAGMYQAKRTAFGTL